MARRRSIPPALLLDAGAELNRECADDADFVSLAKKHNVTAAHFGLILGLLQHMEGGPFSYMDASYTGAGALTTELPMAATHMSESM